MRHICTFCGAKREEKFMHNIWYKFLQKSGWVCCVHMSTNADVLHILNSNKDDVFFELFSGSKHISECAKSFNYKTITVDNNQKLKPSICSNVLDLKLSQCPGSVSIVWASVPCQVYTILALDKHWRKVVISPRNYYYLPKTKAAIEAIRILEKTIWLISRLAPMFYFIENPRGALRHMPQIKNIPFRHTVSYSDYGFDYYKPTDIFTNMPGLQLTKIKTAVGQKFNSCVVNLENNFDRSLVPTPLISSILSQISTIKNSI